MRYRGHEYITPETRQGSHAGYNDIGTIVSVGANLLGSAMSADASEDAADTQAAAADRAALLQKEMFDTTRSDLEPWRRTGGVALNRISELLGLDVPAASSVTGGARTPLEEAFETVRMTPTQSDLRQSLQNPVIQGRLQELGITGPDFGGKSLNQVFEELKASVQANPAQLPGTPAERPADFGSLTRDFTLADLMADPIYALTRDFQMEEGRNMLTNAASARGETDSGALMKELMKYGTNLSSLLGTQAFDRFNTNRTLKYNFLAPTANLGQATGVQLGQLGANTAAQMGGFITQGANAQAAGTVGSANAISGGINSLLQNYQQQQLLDRFMPQGFTSRAWAE